MVQRSERAPRSEIRWDIQGIRAIAVGAVVLYHLWPSRLPGGFIGVDVFFVVSGFLITAHILKGVQHSSAGAFLLSFYTRRIRRLAPAAIVVLLAVGVAVTLWVPVSGWRQEFSGILASLFFVENWHLGFQSVDYLAAENTATAVQHFWSLSVEEQFYIVWPLIILGILALSRSRRVLVAALAVFTVASFAYGVWATGNHPDLAYFATPVRAWQFGAGALAVFVVMRPGRWTLVLPWLGVAMLGISFFGITGEAHYPGVLALIPTLGTVCILLGQEGESRYSFGKMASFRPIQWLGDVSYSVYLWHWPLIVLLPFVLGHGLNLGWKLIVLAATLLLGHLSYRLIETPARRSVWLRPHRRTITAGVLCLIVVAVPAGAAMSVASAMSRTAEMALAEDTAALPECFGALSVDDPGCAGMDRVSPEMAAAAKNDKPAPWPDACANGLEEISTVVCNYGDQASDERVLLWGDSHAGAWAPALDRAGELGGYAVTVAMRHGCPSTSTAPAETSVGRVITAEEQENCQARNDWVLSELVPQFDRIILANMTSNYVFHGDVADQFAGTIDAVAGTGAEPIVLQDVPLTGDDQGDRVDGPDCLAAHGECANPRDRALAPRALAGEIRESAAREFRYVETESRFCDQQECDFARGGVSVYFDASHLSNAYSRSLGDWLADELG